MEAIRGRIAEAVTLASRDLSAWAEVSLGSDRSVAVTGFEADPRLRKQLTGVDFQRFLELQKFRFEPVGSDTPTDLAVTIPIEGIHRAPYVWLARGLMLLYTITLLMITRAIWKARRHHAAAAA